ncbi:MAG: FHA domain-containing protein [Deltaproteobacteria bacterium]|nr:FHA domain-containing protein [Deltaproteobacteria bacterium]
MSTKRETTAAIPTDCLDEKTEKPSDAALLEVDGFSFFSQIHRPLLDSIRDRNEEGLQIAATREDVTSYYPRFRQVSASPVFFTIGTSNRCDLQLPDGDPGISARHLLARYTANDSREDDVSVFLLHEGDSRNEFASENRSFRHAHSRRFAIRTSRTEILFLPVRRRAWRTSAADTWEKLKCGCIYLKGRCRSCAKPAAGNELTRGLIPIDALAWPSANAGVAAVLRLSGDQGGVSRVVGVPPDAEGVVIGRRSLAAMGYDLPSISEPHLAIVRDGAAAATARYFAVDLASQNGSLVNGWGFDQAPLDANARIELGESIELTWEQSTSS